MMCMRCHRMVDWTVFVTKEEAHGTKITGPMVCMHCFASEFPSKPLPEVQYRYVKGQVEHVRRGPLLHVMDPSPVSIAFASASASVSPVLSLDQALFEIACELPTSGNFFTWGPKPYMELWVTAIAENRVLEHAAVVNLEKGCPPQGPGLYLAKTIMSSICWAQFGDPHPLMVTLNRVPTLMFTGRKERGVLLLRVNTLCQTALTELELETFLFSAQFSVPCLKFYGNFSVLSTATNVVATADEGRITLSAKSDMVKASGCEGEGAKKCKAWLLRFK